MKKYLCGLLTLLLLMTSYTVVSAKSGYLTLPQLCAQTPERWTQSYETPWRTVEIDAEIRLPDASVVPILALQGGIASKPSADKTVHWDMTRVDCGMRLILSENDVEYPRSIDGVRVGGPTSKGNWYGGFSSENTYVPMDPITFGELTAMAGDELERLGFSRETLDLAHPDRLWTHHIYAAGTKEDILPGYLFMNFHQMLMGLPILSHILQTVTSSRGEGASSELYPIFESSLCYDGYVGGLTSLCIGYLTPVGLLAEDVPLCPFENVISALEMEIASGRLRKIYEIELGYVVYNEPGLYHAARETAEEIDALYRNATFYVKPMWKVNCLYVSDPRSKLAETASYTDDERNSLDYRQLLVDAQTGELIEESAAKDRAEFKGFLSWKDAQ